MIKRALAWSLGVCFALLLPVSAHAVVTDLHITGHPTECVIHIEQPGKPPQTVKTDTTGHAKVDLVPDQPVTVKPQNHDFASVPVTETPPPPGQPFEVPVMPSAPLAQNPTDFGSFALAPRYDGDYFHHMKITKDEETQGDKTTVSNGHNLPDTTLNVNEGSVDIPFGVPAIRLFDRTYLIFSPIFSVGGATFNLKFTKRTEPGAGETSKFNGSGAMLGGGFGATILNMACSCFGGLDVLYRTNLNPSVTRSPSLSEISKTEVPEKDNLSYDQWYVAVRGGYDFSTGILVFRSLAPFAGIAFVSSNVTLKGTFGTGKSTTTFKTEIAANDLRGLFGVDSQIWGPVFGRAQVTFNDEDVSVLAKLVLQIDVHDWWHQ